MFKKEIRSAIWALIFISLGGLLLHLRIHSPKGEISNWIPALFGIFSVCILPFMFNSAKMVKWAYVLNLLTVVLGIIAMTYYSFEHPPQQITLTTIILQTTLADNLILLAKVPLGYIILKYYRPY